ncbi:DNA-binding protein WhiA [Mycoplasmopsis bovirhinis]|uniref:Probable cell division protein WhiA n=1 Tax=Mycoplasmopsis bovirhinis TaxID=29553 RepID=A0A449AEX1_9BACT|nr:DNA-binding protein WhiA [Mycoplasmopsis bovirhinis]VEU63516.1 Uncharacterized protein conserved in bacteria [Mycoplasmopsis bovirhinis]
MKTKVSFTSKIKKEILINSKKRLEDYYLLKGMFFANSNLTNKQDTLVIKNTYIKDKIINKLAKNNFKYTTKSEWKHKIILDKDNFDWSNIFDNDKYLTSFFAGIFLGSGNISDLNTTSYHLEISTLTLENSKLIQNKLNKYNFSFHLIKKRNRYILYIKKIDELLDFLSAIGAKKAWFKLQDLKIVRDKDNVLNRTNNIDFSNLQKIANSSIKHIENINYVFENNLLDHFTNDQLMFFRLKTENPWLSLNELVFLQQNQSNNTITKSGANHWFRKLDKVVLTNKNNKKKTTEI